jgi:hypothetical protein
MYFAARKQLIMRNLLLAAALIPALHAPAQKYEQKLDALFQPVKLGGRYHALIEKKDSGWHRTAVYIPEKTKAVEAWYKDKECSIPNGRETWYHPAGNIKSTGLYINGKKQGTWKQYHENGVLNDSVTYADGKVRGLHLNWHNDGKLADSTMIDPMGNGTEVDGIREAACTLRANG